MSAAGVIDAARGELGYAESPRGSHETRYGRAYGWDGVPWSVIFLWWCFREAGESAAFYGGAKTSSCAALLRWYRERGLTVPPEDLRPGDILLLDFSGGGEAQHCALALQTVNREEGWYRTIEGDAAPGPAGSQTGGGCVVMKVRGKRNVLAVCRPAYREEAADGLLPRLPEVREHE